MDIIFLSNGLGNQMSQYALYLEKVTLGTPVKYITHCKEHNGFELDKVFNIKKDNIFLRTFLTIIFRLIQTNKRPFNYIKYIFPWIKIHNENYVYRYNQKYKSKNTGMNFFIGGWHDENYFNTSNELVKKTFDFRHIDSQPLSKYIYFIKNTNNSVGIHVRRGDYMDPKNINTFGKVCDEIYYKSAIEKINQLIENPIYFVFSNDINWAKDKFGDINMNYINDASLESWMDMYLMSLCKNNIIANSTFSWWAAWLNKNESKIVICPKKFIFTDDESDIYPNKWIRV